MQFLHTKTVIEIGLLIKLHLQSWQEKMRQRT